MLWRRLAAALIDTVAIAIALLYFLVLTWRITFLFVPLNARVLVAALAAEGLILIWAAYTILCPAVGLRMLDLHVVRVADGALPSLARRAFRSLVIVLTGPVGLAFMFFDPKRRTLWDMLSRTQVTQWEWEEAGEEAKADWSAIFRRLPAYLIDHVVIALLAIPTVLATGQPFRNPELAAVWSCLSIVYFTLFVPTPGQRLWRLRAVSADGKPAGILRRFARGLTVGGMFTNFGITFMWLLSTALMLGSKQILTPWDYVSRLRFVRETRRRKGPAGEKPVSDTGGEWMENTSGAGSGI